MDGTASLFPPLPAGDVSLVLPQERLPYDALAERLQPRIPAGATLVGESFSGPLAVLLANRVPVRRVVLVASFVTPPAMRWPRWLLRGLFSVPPPGPVLRMLLLEREATDELLSALQTAIASVPAEVLADRARRVMEVDVREALGRVDAPVTYLRAMRDRVVGAGAADVVQAVRPDAEVVDVDGPHLLLQTRWAACQEWL